MLNVYISYKCKCGKEFVLLTEEALNTKGYLVCPYCSSRNVKVQGSSDSLKECMKERSYKRNRRGALEQR